MRGQSRLALIGSIVAALLAGSAPSQAQTIEPGLNEECFETVPASLAVPVPEPVIEILLHVVLDDGVTLEEGRQTVEATNVAYERIGLRIKPSFTTASMRSDDTQELFTQLKGLFGGARP